MLTEYPFQNFYLADITGEEWKNIPGLECYYMISNFGRVKRLKHYTERSNGIIVSKNEKIIKPSINKAKNKFKNDHVLYLVSSIFLNKIRYNLTISRLVYYCFVESFNLNDRSIFIINKDRNALNICPANLIKSNASIKSKRIDIRGRRNNDAFKKFSFADKQRQKKALIKKLSKKISQYSLQGNKIKTFTSIRAAQKSTGACAQGIGRTAAGKAFSAGKYYWRFGSDDKIDVAVIAKAKLANKKTKGIKVTQYDLQGNKIAQFNSLKEAQRQTGADPTNIRKVLQGKTKKSKGFYWKKGFGKNKINLKKNSNFIFKF